MSQEGASAEELFKIYARFFTMVCSGTHLEPIHFRLSTHFTTELNPHETAAAAMGAEDAAMKRHLRSPAAFEHAYKTLLHAGKATPAIPPIVAAPPEVIPLPEGATAPEQAPPESPGIPEL